MAAASFVRADLKLPQLKRAYNAEYLFGASAVMFALRCLHEYRQIVREGL
jgi:hypothetical protein